MTGSRIHFLVSIGRAYRGQFNEAQGPLEAGLKLDSSTWLASCAQGFVEASAKKWDKAALHLKECLSLNPGYSPACYLLAEALLNQGKPEAARDEYLTYLQGETEPALANEARLQIARINERLAATGIPSE